ncbi:MAG: hypothetical protein IPG45_16190 [Deltaproteobacteria bacterium]|nr:hypothetical protein [Deltaproteobacteria bacterium]
MLIELVQEREAVVREPDEMYDSELHDVNTIIMDVCRSLGDSNAFAFRVSGFGDLHWPVDVATDLATVLEQLPGALLGLRQGLAFQIDFFEQGVQRRLEFEPEGSRYHVICLSGTEWRPNPPFEFVDAKALDAMLRAVGQAFVASTKNLLPDTAAHPWFVAYASGLAG